MILPTKHLKLNDSLVAGGSVILSNLTHSQTISSLWDKVRKTPDVDNYKRFTLILSFLYMIGAIDYSDNMIRRGGKHDS